jgi:hypothetical protein
MITLPEAAKLARIHLARYLNGGCVANSSVLHAEAQEALTALDAALASSAEPTEPVAAMRAALEQIERWDGFPPTGEFWDINGDRPVSYGINFGSNGERDFMRGIARAALTTPPAQAEPAVRKTSNSHRGGSSAYLATEHWNEGWNACLDATPPAQAEPSAQEPAGIKLAVRWLEMRRDDYVHEFGSYDPETGATEYGRGAKGQAREEYVAEIEEVIEGIRALAACDVPPAGWSCSRSMGHEGPCAATPSPQDSASVAGALVAGCEVITPPGAAIRASVIHLTDAGREALTAKGVKSIPGVQAAPVAAAPDTLWADVWLRTRLAEMFHLMDEMRAALRTEGQAK